MPRPFRRGNLKKGDLELRDQTMLMRRLQGDSVAELKERFNCSKATVDRALQRARKQNVIAIGREFVLTDIVAPALVAIKTAVETGDINTAMEVVKLVGILAPAVAAPDASGRVVEEFEEVRRRILFRPAPTDTQPAIDAEVTIHEEAPARHGSGADAEDQGGEAGEWGLRGLLPGPPDDPARDE